MPGPKVTVYTDGASRGNPGPAAAAFVIAHDDVPILEYAEPIGKATNNFAEYTAMIRALDCCRQLGVKKLRLHSDSELMVKQMRGEYQVRHPDILPLFAKARDLVSEFQHVEFVHVPRAENAEADRLGNEALDGTPHPLPALEGFHFPDVEPEDIASVPDAAQITVLQRAYDAWSSGDDSLKPADVWSELQKSLVQESRLKPSAESKPSRGTRRRKK
jgi:ribonuclease HI